MQHKVESMRAPCEDQTPYSVVNDLARKACQPLHHIEVSYLSHGRNPYTNECNGLDRYPNCSPIPQLRAKHHSTVPLQYIDDTDVRRNQYFALNHFTSSLGLEVIKAY